MIEKILDKVCEDQSENFSSYDAQRVHAIEAARCTRLSYFERKDPILADNVEKISILLKQGVRHSTHKKSYSFFNLPTISVAMIEKILDKVCEDQSENFSSYDAQRVHAIEAARCTRLSYFERKDPILADNVEKISILLKQGVRHSFKNVHSEYKVDDLTLGVTADLILNNEFIVKFEVVSFLPEMPHPRDLLYINACLFAFKKLEGILVYITYEGKFEEFTVTKSNRMFEEIIRRAKILSTLLTENKLPIVEPSEMCLSCKYYGRCYNREKKGSSYSLENLFAFRKKDGNHISSKS